MATRNLKLHVVHIKFLLAQRETVIKLVKLDLVTWPYFLNNYPAIHSEQLNTQLLEYYLSPGENMGQYTLKSW